MHNSFQDSGLEMESSIQTGHPNGYRSGAGIFRFASSRGPAIELWINPIDYHTWVANTIQRAKLVGIFKALQVDHSGPNLMIYTDSLASMYMIDKHMRCPSSHKECRHEEFLSLIVEALAKKAREGVHVQLLKVKSHIGIEGNEKADALAHEACKPECCTDIVSEGVEIREDIFWPHFLAGKFTIPLEGLRPFLWMLWEESNQARQTLTVKTLLASFRWLISGRCSRRYSRQGAREASQTRRSMYWHGWQQGRTYRERSAIISGQALKSQHQLRQW